MGFFSSIGNFFKKAGNGIKQGFTTVYKKALVPLYNKVIKPVYKKVIKPIGERAIKFVKGGVDRIERLGNAGVSAAEGVGKILNSNTFYYMALGVGGLVMVSVLKK